VYRNACHGYTVNCSFMNNNAAMVCRIQRLTREGGHVSSRQPLCSFVGVFHIYEGRMDMWLLLTIDQDLTCVKV
jgi:hypothetical protein